MNPCPHCGKPKPRDKAFCLTCWRMLPHRIQRQVWASYRERDMYEHLDFLMRLGNRLAVGTGEWPSP